MKTSYIKTTWVDNKTPVNASNMNHIESAISDLYGSALSPSEVVGGDGINVSLGSDKNLTISADDTVMKSTTCTGVEFITDGESVDYMKDKIYFILDPDTKKLKKIIINGVTIYEME